MNTNYRIIIRFFFFTVVLVSFVHVMQNAGAGQVVDDLNNEVGPFSFKEINAIEKFDLKKPNFLQASDGVELAYYRYVDPSDKKIVILYAGAGLYGNKTYQWVAKTLHDTYGIGCYIFDVRGHGNSQGARGDASSINRV